MEDRKERSENKMKNQQPKTQQEETGIMPITPTVKSKKEDLASLESKKRKGRPKKMTEEGNVQNIKKASKKESEFETELLQKEISDKEKREKEKEQEPSKSQSQESGIKSDLPIYLL